MENFDLQNLRSLKSFVFLLSILIASTASSQTITTFAGTGVAGFSGDGGPATNAQFNFPAKIKRDNAGNLYVVDFLNSRIRKIDSFGNISTIAGDGSSSSTGDNGPAVSAGLSGPIDIAFNSVGEIFIAEMYGDRIRRIDHAGIITTYAGTGVAGFSGDNGPATSAQLSSPMAITFDANDNLYIADADNYRIRYVNRDIGSGSLIEKLAGNGASTATGDGGNCSMATVGYPISLAVKGNVLYFGDYLNNQIRMIDLTTYDINLVTTTIAAGGSYSPVDISFDNANNMYIADDNSSVIRFSSGTTTVFAGTPTLGYSGDGMVATSAQLNYPHGVCVGSSGEIYVADKANNRIRMIKAPQTITFSSLPSKTYRNPSFMLTATALSGLPVSYSSDNTNVATITGGNTVNIVGAGSANITASQIGNGIYDAAPAVTRALTVARAGQTITFNTLAPVAVGSGSITLPQFASSGLDITYTSSNVSVATVTGNIISVLGTGTTDITATQAGDNNYNAAVAVVQTLTVKNVQTITFGTLPAKKYGDASFDAHATASSHLPISLTSSDTHVATVNDNSITIVGAGTCTITASQVGNGNYSAAADVTQTLTVSKADQTITFGTLATKNQGDAPFQLSATSSSALPITFTVSSGPANITGNILILTGAGPVTLTASQAGNANYNAATDVAQSFCVNPSQPTITYSITSPDAPVLMSSSSQGNQWYNNGTAISGSTSSSMTATAAGSYTVQVTVGGCVGPQSNPQVVVVTGVEKSVDFTCHPNPTQSEITIQWPASESVQNVQIVDAAGRITISGGQELVNNPISIEHYKAGTFVVRVKYLGGISTSKFIKK